MMRSSASSATTVLSSAKPTSTQRFGILSSWNYLKGWPLGSWVFDWLIAWNSPYSASIPYKTVSLSPGNCIMTLADKYKLRNPFKSIHAVALVNLGELCSGLALLSAFEAVSEYQKKAISDPSKNVIVSYRGIVKSLESCYYKKARGTLTAVCQVGAGKGATKFDADEVANGTCQYVSDELDEDQVTVVADIYDSEHELVASISVIWNVKKKQETYASCHYKSKSS